MGSKNDYEEVRRQRLEENKRRMEELNLTGLATSLHQASNTASKSAKRSSNPRKQRTEEGAVVVRRSSRVANNPPPDYREAPVDIPYLRRSYGRSRSLLSHAIASVKASREAAEHAYDIESGLGSTYPTFVKPMLHSHISSGFWLGLPADFCKAHLPKQNTRMILEDENGDETETLYLAGKVGLSAGWRGYSIQHGLIEGDCLVFQLIPPNRFKVYIVRSADFESGNNSSQRALDSESDSVQELSVSEKRKRSSEDEEEASNESVKAEEASNESVEADGKLSKKSKMSKGLGEAKDGKQQPKKSGKKPLQNSDGEEQEKQQNGNKGPKSKKKEDTTAEPKSKGAQVKSKSKKQINSMMPIRKTPRSEAHIKPSNGRIVTVAA